RCQQRAWHVPSRIVCLTGRHRRHLKTRKGVNEQENGLGKSSGGRTRTKRKCACIQKKQTCCNEDYKRDQLADREEVTDDRRLAHANYVDGCQQEDDENNNHRSPEWAVCSGPEVTHIADHQIAVSSKCGQPRQPDQPANFERRGSAEGPQRISIRSAGLLKAAA